jgi:excisionase family DNA binding protein
MSAEPWVGVDDVARHLGVSHDTVYRWIENKRLPAHKVGRLWKFKLADVDEWVRSGGASDEASASSTEEAG